MVKTDLIYTFLLEFSEMIYLQICNLLLLKFSSANQLIFSKFTFINSLIELQGQIIVLCLNFAIIGYNFVIIR